MKFVNIHDAKTHLSKYIEELRKTHDPIVICKNGVPLVQLIEYIPSTPKKLGLLKGKITMADDFNAPLPEAMMGDYLP